MIELVLFASTFVLVFALGFQSLNVNGGHYRAAFMTSFLIGSSNLVLYKLAPNANATEMIAFLLGGPFGIITSMWVHKKTIGKNKHATRTGHTCKQSKDSGQCYKQPPKQSAATTSNS